jgi:hypothetical protein
MGKDKDFNEPLRDYALRVARVYAHNIKEVNAELHMETPVRHHFTHLKYLHPMRKVKVLLDEHVSTYQANKSLGMGKSINKLKNWADTGAIVDKRGQVYIKSGKPVEGWIKPEQEKSKAKMSELFMIDASQCHDGDLISHMINKGWVKP